VPQPCLWLRICSDVSGVGRPVYASGFVKSISIGLSSSLHCSSSAQITSQLPSAGARLEQ
jgi:hypothetical protein